METSIYNRDAIEHLHRYAIVENYIKNKIVMDIACGEGYGSNIIKNNAKFVYGIDLDKNTIEHAKVKYKASNLKFLSGSTSKIPLENNSIEIAISFETIEHHNEHQEMMQEIKRVLKSNGIIIISTPDKLYYSDKRNFNNKFHIRELYKTDFKNLISNHFKNIQIVKQFFINKTSYISNESVKPKFYKGNYNKTNTTEIDPLYLIAVASDDIFKQLPESLFDGSEILIDTAAKVYQSTSYKLGRLILTPFRVIKRIVKNFK